jgi:hypothetical protein
VQGNEWFNRIKFIFLHLKNQTGEWWPLILPSLLDQQKQNTRESSHVFLSIVFLMLFFNVAYWHSRIYNSSTNTSLSCLHGTLLSKTKKVWLVSQLKMPLNSMKSPTAEIWLWHTLEWRHEFSNSLVEFLFGIGSSNAEDCLSSKGQPL